jgi:hypothetical protein
VRLPGLVSFHHLRPTDWRQRILQPTAAATVTGPTAAEVELEAVRAAAEQRAEAECRAATAEQRATPESQFRAKADAAEEMGCR